MPGVNERLAQFDVEAILPLIDTDLPKMIYNGHEIDVNSLRLQTFKHKGCVCVRCGLIGTTFIAERNRWLGRGRTRRPNPGRFHINLYAYDRKGRERLMTKDHIFPKSLGGRDELENMQTMCANCNQKKGNDIEYDLVNHHWVNYLPPYSVSEPTHAICQKSLLSQAVLVAENQQQLSS